MNEHEDGEPVAWFKFVEVYAGLTYVYYCSDDGVMHGNESLMIFFPDDYWSWPKH